MAKYFSKSRALRDSWHRELLRDDLVEQFASGQLEELPASIVELTNAYLDRKKLLPCTTQCESCLTELIDEHARRNGSPHLALLACIRFYSRSTALAILESMRNGVSNLWNSTDHQKYLRCLLLVHSLMPTYVLYVERGIAALLLAIFNQGYEALVVFRRLVHELAKLMSSWVLPSEYVNSLLRFCDIREKLEAHLAMLQSEVRFAELYDFIRWVAAIKPPHQCPLAHDVMREHIPQLKAWLAWKPREKFLDLSASHFTPEQLIKLRPILALEGPDTTAGSQRGTLKEAGPAALLATSISPPELHLAVQLQNLLVDAVQTGPLLRPPAVDMLVSLCIDQPATAESLALARRVLYTRNEECYKTALAIADGMAPAAGMATRMDTIARALPILVTNPDVRELYSENIIGAVESTMTAAQDMYRRHLSTKLGDEFCFNIQAYGTALRRETWLHQHLSPDFVAKIHRFPPGEVLEGIVGRAQHTSPLPAATEQAMRQYLLATLCSEGTADEIAEHRAVVDADQEFWITHPEFERNKVMLAIRSLYEHESAEDRVFLRAFRRLIPYEDIFLLRDLLPRIERNTNNSCSELVSIVARRTQVPVGCHGVWVSLALFMLHQRVDSVLDWACNDLPLELFLQWVADMQLLAARDGVGATLLEQIGLTPSRLEWCAQLRGPYFPAASFLDRLQQRDNQGRSSLKWLYLQTVPGVAPLVDAMMMDNQQLGYDREWLFSLYDGTEASMANICVFVERSLACGPHGRVAIRTIIKRSLESPANWPDHAAVAYAMAWMKSGKLTPADQVALQALVEVLDLQLGHSTRGVMFLRKRMLQDYNRTIELARELESLRERLARTDAKRAAALVARLGMKDVQPYVDAAVPAGLSDTTECVDAGVYEMWFPLTHLDEIDFTVRGISSSLPMLMVRIGLTGSDRSRHGFCVHMLPLANARDQYQHPQQQHHELCTAYSSPVNRVCGPTLQMFTHALARRLWRLFAASLDGPAVTLQGVHDVVSDVIRRPGAECTACGDRLVNVWRPTICTKPECYQEQQHLSLYIRCHGLLMDAPVLDFLLCCLHAAASDVRQNPNLKLLTEDLPFTNDQLLTIINSFPELPATASGAPWQLLRTIRDGDSDERRAILLVWMSKWFRGCLMTAPPGQRLAIMSNVEQFVLLNSTPECEEAFQKVMSSSPSSASSASSPSSLVVFHGSQAGRMWRVLTEGLRNMSHTAYMRNGALSGSGIYVADEPAKSFQYSASLGGAWRHSAFGRRKILLGCELLDGTTSTRTPAGRNPLPDGTHVVTDESRVLVRYVFLCPEDYRPPPSRHVRPAMQTTFAALRAGPV